MAHHIHAFIGPPHVLATLAKRLPHPLIVPLTTEFSALPYIPKREEGVEIGHPVFLQLTAALEEHARTVSLEGPIAYIETEYFGGMGEQRAMAWRDGTVIVLAAEEERQVNRALEAIGVVPTEGMDAWDTLGLLEYRDDERFFEKAGVPLPYEEE